MQKVPEGLIPVSKNGKFLGFADERQIKAHAKLKRLEVVPQDPPAKAPKPRAQKPESSAKASSGADPKAVSRGPKKS